MARDYDKLVRDRIPDIITENGEEPIYRIADEEEYRTRLLEKLDEEVAEYRESQEIAELADILEVLHAIRDEHGVSVEQLQTIRARKADRRGRFEEGIVLERVEE